MLYKANIKISKKFFSILLLSLSTYFGKTKFSPVEADYMFQRKRTGEINCGSSFCVDILIISS